MKRPQTVVILAMSLDGKIADAKRSKARFSSSVDRFHLEKQLAYVDAALFGAGTLRAYGTTLPIKTPDLIEWRQQQNKPPQPIHIVCSASGNIDPNFHFFRQKVQKWLLTTHKATQLWFEDPNYFERILLLEDWNTLLEQLWEYGIKKLAILGGGELVASLIEQDLIDEFCLTLCPVILGGVDAPTPVEGTGIIGTGARNWELFKVERVENELFLNYRRVTVSS
ncbi:riboflavin deaminase [Aphanothece hegewaldii CCALA 016]|uniref:Riboflavin deaminase n=1 Tax=Aphanothece hegewaldii CCALA 016 TaxID=2107694 RepID=A0A2T1LTQ3_9CHRO|nr:RibD family protein [Aphanothece hegewaldii]PSF34487.1 riboflavin deaminase [Aphanothece hegewaldii CCALA 016]